MNQEIMYKRSEIILGMLKVFGVTFCFCAIIPISLTIWFLVKNWSEIHAWSFSYNLYGELSVAIDFGLLIGYWLIITFPLSIANAIGKGCMYTKKKKAIFIVVPIVACALVIILGLLGGWIAQGVANRWL